MKLSVEPQLTPEFWDRDNLGILPPRRCAKCRQCSERGECSDKHRIHSVEEEMDLKAIEENVEIKREKCLGSLKSNPNLILAQLKSAST